MSIEEELTRELKDAMRSKDRPRIDVIRNINAEVDRRVKEPAFDGEADDDLYREVIEAYEKKMRKALEEYEGYGERGAAGADKLRFEVEYLQRWLPERASEEEVAAMVDEAIAELGVDDPKMAGRVTGWVMQRHDNVDGALVNRLARERLGGDED